MIGSFPPKMEHLISDYITIIRIISALFAFCLLCTLYQHNYVYWVSMEATICATVWLGCAPRTSCSRRIDDEILARPVKDTDLLLLGSAHPVPRENFVLRWQSMARRVANSPVQWAHLNPRACGTFLTRRLSSWPASSIKQGRSPQGPGRFLGQLAG